MAKKLLLWLFLSWKRAGTHPFFVLLFLVLPITSFAVRQVEKQDSGTISIALYTDGDAWNQKAAEELMRGDGAFSFYLCESEEKVEKEVAAGHAECGYLFPANFRERLEQGTYKRAIRVIVSPSTAAADLASETVFAGFFKVLGKELLETYVTEAEAFAAEGGEAAWSEIECLYEKAGKDGSTFAFVYETIDGTNVEENRMKASFPVRGLGAVFVFVMGLAAAVTAAEDEKRGLYAAVSGGQKRVLQAASMSAMILAAGASFLVSLLFAGELKSLSLEAAVLLFYSAVVLVFSLLLLCLVKNPLFLSALIPFFILGSLITCPVFVDLSLFVPALSVVRRFCLPWYYLCRIS